VYVEVFWVVYVFVGARLNGIEDLPMSASDSAVDVQEIYPRLKIKENGSGDVARVVGLVEENVFAVTALCREVFQITVSVDTVFSA
jgi:hypothetical protein